MIFLAFDLSSSEERFERVKSYWWTEIKKTQLDIPIILVGLKLDGKAETITSVQGQAMAV